MKKGFTLIELLAVIIILAIIALIATPLVLNVVEDAKKSTAKTETAHIVDAVNLNCQLYASKVQMGELETNPCDGGVDATEIKTMVESGNYTYVDVRYDGTKVAKAIVTSNGYNVYYENGTYTYTDITAIAD